MVKTRNTGGDANPPNIEEIVAQAVVAAIQNMPNERNDGVGSSNEGIHVWIERFNKLKPNSFLLATTPTAASDWINHCEKFFQAKSADFVETCTWVAFREAFYKRFIPLSEQQRFEREYGAIYQEERENAAEYMERFLRLASFVGPTVTGDATRQARHYKSRDGDRIQNRSSGQQDKGSGYQGRAEQNYDHRGRSDRQYDNRGKFDRGYDQGRQFQRGSDYKSTGRQNDKSGNNNPRQSSRGNQNNRRAEATPVCRTCGKSHTGPCRTASGACYECGSTEHQVRNCPKKANIVPAGPSQPSTSSGRVHSLTREQAVNSSGTITGFIHIGDFTAFVLFDTGATYSIISITFSKKLKLTPTPLMNSMSISTPMKSNVIIDHEFLDCPLRFDDRIRPANLLPLNMLDFDLILGMDWLTSHRATIVCHE
ncbi:reverse transcriptase domain-containing protein [Artemisia annua]|uniref:Reverse transcriptase domain-containing protein n=1 Tax=Artemisia annua TaxID=35608 RepID=A0A2U1PCM2_ARTAN|nr:reverse transcriptase domain-containing protein [Artemisia annua]